MPLNVRLTDTGVSRRHAELHLDDGKVTLVTQGEIDKMPVRLPMVEIRTIGAGGGSIARVNSAGTASGSRRVPSSAVRAERGGVVDIDPELERLRGRRFRMRHKVELHLDGVAGGG